MRSRAAVAMSPYLADSLRRAGLSTTETRRGDVVFFAAPPRDGAATRHVVKASLNRRGTWDLVDAHTGASVRGCVDQERAEKLAEILDAEAEVRRRCGQASLSLPGLSTKVVERGELRSVAVTLARSGHMPYGVESVDYGDVAGFLILPDTGRTDVAYVHRLTEPWGDVRPGERSYGPAVAVRRFDKDLAAYAACLARPGRWAATWSGRVRVEFRR